MLTGLDQQALVVETIARLKAHGSWAGETHVQKSLFFLKNLLDVPFDYNFVLYKHGPYSFDLHHDVGKMRAYSFLDLEPRMPYGPSFAQGDMAKQMLARFDTTVRQYRDAIEFVAMNLGEANVRELERYATALYVKLEYPNTSPVQLANTMIELKPHITKEEAAVAIQYVEDLAKLAAQQNLVRSR